MIYNNPRFDGHSIREYDLNSNDWVRNDSKKIKAEIRYQLIVITFGNKAINYPIESNILFATLDELIESHVIMKAIATDKKEALLNSKSDILILQEFAKIKLQDFPDIEIELEKRSDKTVNGQFDDDEEDDDGESFIIN